MYVYMRAAGHSNYTRRWEERSFLLSLFLTVSLSVHVKRPSLGPSISTFFSRRCGVLKARGCPS